MEKDIPVKNASGLLEKSELRRELDHILRYWIHRVADPVQGGFYGNVDENNIPDSSAPRGIVMYSRILWAFSAAYDLTRNSEYLDQARSAYREILNTFLDTKYGGVYWSVSPKGEILESKKQLYGQAFCIYGLSEYFRATGEVEARDQAIALFEKIESHGFDSKENGYIEAFSAAWEPLADLRLSAKDDNERKTMNTHLHIVEAYACLYSVWPDEGLRKRIQNLLFLFDKYFIDPKTFHLRLFFNDQWESRSSLISYGHDIEAAWLLAGCAQSIQDPYWIDKLNGYAGKIAAAAARGLDEDGGLWYEYDPSSEILIREKHSWPQAEALLGFYHAWKTTGLEKFRVLFLNTWSFIREYIIDHKNGEWHWGIQADYSTMKKPKAGFWKCPYHNSRALIELIKQV